MPVFGHFLYPDGDPRADVVLAALWELPGTEDLRRRVDQLAGVVAHVIEEYSEEPLRWRGREAVG